MENLSNSIMNFLHSQIFPFVVTFIIVGFVVGGLAIMSGQRARRIWAKGHLGFVILGFVQLYIQHEYWEGPCSLVWLVKICLAVGRESPSPTVSCESNKVIERKNKGGTGR